MSPWTLNISKPLGRFKWSARFDPQTRISELLGKQEGTVERDPKKALKASQLVKKEDMCKAEQVGARV